MGPAFVLATIWIFVGLFIHSWWPQWTGPYAILAVLLAIPMVIVHSDFLFNAVFKPQPIEPPIVPQPPPVLTEQEVDILINEVLANRPNIPALRSFVKGCPPTKEMREQVKTFLASFLADLERVSSPLLSTEVNPEFGRVREMPTPEGTAAATYPYYQPAWSYICADLAKHYHYPVPYDYKQRFEHTWICGTTGSGKSTLLKRLILHDLDAEKPPSLIVMENAGDVIPWLTHLDHFHPEHGKLKDKLYIFTPSQPPPAINIFHRYAEGETAIEDTLSIFRYLFDCFDIDLTGHQGLLFTPCIRFLLSFPETVGRDANLADLIHLLEVPMPRVYREAAERLDDPILRAFILGMFNDKMYEDRKKELITRLIGIRNDGYLGRMLSTESTGLSLYKLLNDGAVIAIDTAGLGGNSTKYGRLCIALVLNAIFARFTIPERDRKPTFLFVDEAQTVMDDKTRDLLQSARKFKLGGVFAHQQLADLTASKLEPYLSGQTSIRLIGRAPAGDWNSLAAYVYARPGATAAQRHDPEFIGRQEGHHFACWIREVTPQGVSVSVDAALVDNAKPMGERAYEELLLNNRTRIGVKEEAAPASRWEDPPAAASGRAASPLPKDPPGGSGAGAKAGEFPAGEETIREATEPPPPPFEEKKSRRNRPGARERARRRGPLIDPDA